MRYLARVLNLISMTSTPSHYICHGILRLAHLTAKALGSAEPKLVNFIWHGGEPLLLGRDFFRKALSLQEKFLQPRRYVLNSIQTNGTLIDEAWCEFFGRNKFTVGISID
jgi:uncharacterized protein